MLNLKVKKGFEKMYLNSLYDKLLNDERYYNLNSQEKQIIMENEAFKLGIDIDWI